MVSGEYACWSLCGLRWTDMFKELLLIIIEEIGKAQLAYLRESVHRGFTEHLNIAYTKRSYH